YCPARPHLVRLDLGLPRVVVCSLKRRSSLAAPISAINGNTPPSQLDIIIDSAGNIRLKQASPRNVAPSGGAAPNASPQVAEVVPFAGTLTDRSGTIPAGGAAQTLAAS